MKRRRKVLAEDSEISIKLEQYDDIFSDFDMRDLSQRALSVDFIDEMRRGAEDKDESKLELALYVPEGDRSTSTEETIKERLAKHFSRHLQLVMKEKRSTLMRGWSMVFLGMVAMIAATFIVFEDPSENFTLSFFVVFLEPAAWFLLWEGMDQIIFNSKEINPELSFYKKMSAAHQNIHFKPY